MKSAIVSEGKGAISQLASTSDSKGKSILGYQVFSLKETLSLVLFYSLNSSLRAINIISSSSSSDLSDIIVSELIFRVRGFKVTNPLVRRIFELEHQPPVASEFEHCK